MHERKNWLGHLPLLIVVLHTGVVLARRSTGLYVPAIRYRDHR